MLIASSISAEAKVCTPLVFLEGVISVPDGSIEEYF